MEGRLLLALWAGRGCAEGRAGGRRAAARARGCSGGAAAPAGWCRRQAILLTKQQWGWAPAAAAAHRQSMIAGKLRRVLQAKLKELEEGTLVSYTP
eukprot:COSAG04_NODE_1835_length_5442_cov_19.996631_6_plen_95_part_01